MPIASGLDLDGNSVVGIDGSSKRKGEYASAQRKWRSARADEEKECWWSYSEIVDVDIWAQNS
jgi:hypothetical protein